MMVSFSLLKQEVIDKFPTSIIWQSFFTLLILFILILIIEKLCGNSLERYSKSAFRTDSIYALLIVGGVYGLVQQPIINLLDSILRNYANFIYLNALQSFVDWGQLIIFFIVVDFFRYWKHRWLHSNSVLQKFHIIHHAINDLNFLTTYRIHLMEYLIDGIITLIPIVILGIPPKIGVLFYLTLIVYSAMNHSGFNINFGYLNKVLVSPCFHAIHHSSNPKDYNSNFGSLLTIWDIWFGTANFKKPRVLLYGLSAVKVPSSFLGQLIFPFKLFHKKLIINSNKSSE